tara:strand:+ start:177 stop:569 length:393 start_codon:yes stop_codon:yes gene_type:complete
MSENFQLEIISPEKTFLKSEVQQVTIPSFEGLMTILKDHISIVTFLRPGLIELKKSESLEKFFVEEGTVEFSKNKLLILSASIIDLKNLNNDLKSKIIQETKNQLNNEKVNDKDRYILNHKISSLEEINS